MWDGHYVHLMDDDTKHGGLSDLPMLEVCWSVKVWKFPFNQSGLESLSLPCHVLPLYSLPFIGWGQGHQTKIEFQLHSFVIVYLFSRVWLFAVPWTAAHQASLSFTISRSLFKSHVHWISDAIPPSHSLLSPSPLALNRSQCQGLFQWVSSLHKVAKVLEFQLQHQSFKWIFRVVDFL